MRLEVKEGLGWYAGDRVADARPSQGGNRAWPVSPRAWVLRDLQAGEATQGQGDEGLEVPRLSGGGMSSVQPVRPRCYNRPPFAAGRLEFGINRDTGARVETYLSNDWFEARCATWDGVGIGQPTDDYPTGTPYPIAHGFDCAGCRWKPEGTP